MKNKYEPAGGQQIQTGKQAEEMRERKRKFRWLVSLMKERAWLEEMSLQGWFLTDVRLGVLYEFERREPKRTAYDVERFDLTKNPTRREIQEKSNLMDMAEEMGWRQVCRDESLNYYIAREWRDDETNELYDSPEEREKRVERYSRMFTDKIHLILWCCVAMQILTFIFWMRPEKEEVGWFVRFNLVYTLVCLCFVLAVLRWKRRIERELKLSLEEWKAVYGRKDTVTKFRLALTVKGVERYLEKQAAAGYHLKYMRVYRFVFSEGEPAEISYMMDTKYLTNRRRKKSGNDVFKDSKDWEGRNNDWQVQSLREAEAAGWEFAGAVECRNILYRAEKGHAVPLNEGGGFRVTSAVGGMAVFIATSGLIGGIIGFLFGYFFM